MGGSLLSSCIYFPFLWFTSPNHSDCRPFHSTAASFNSWHWSGEVTQCTFLLLTQKAIYNVDSTYLLHNVLFILFWSMRDQILKSTQLQSVARPSRLKLSCIKVDFRNQSSLCFAILSTALTFRLWTRVIYCLSAAQHGRGPHIQHWCHFIYTRLVPQVKFWKCWNVFLRLFWQVLALPTPTQCAHNFGNEAKYNVNAPCLQIIRSSMIIGCRGQGGIVVGARLALMAPCKNSTKTPFKRPCKCMALILWFSAHFLAIRVLLFQVNGQFLG